MPTDSNADFVVSIASYPKRDHFLPAVFEALTRQIIKPQKWILVLSMEEYPNGLPKHLKKLQNRGIEIIWSKNNPFAVKKLIPVIEKYPNLAVITLDDDIIYHINIIQNLVENKFAATRCIVGHVGKVLYKKGRHLNMMYRGKQPASLSTPSDQVFLIGCGGIYYPAKSLGNRAMNLNAISKIVPGRGSDIWFWAAAIAKGTEQICIGTPKDYNFGIPIPQNKQTAPKDRPGGDELEIRFQKTIDYFEIREKLLNCLPEKYR